MTGRGFTGVRERGARPAEHGMEQREQLGRLQRCSIVPLVYGRLAAISGPIRIDERTSLFAPGVRGYAPANVYVAGFMLWARRTVHQRAASVTAAAARAP